MNDIEALKKFSENLDVKLSREESIRNLEKSLVEIVYAGRSHRGNGLLMTDNGYFLTADHCLGYNPIYIRDFKGNFYPIKEVLKNDSIKDIAIAMAEIKESPIPKRYNILNAENLKKYCDRRYELCLKTFRKGKIENSFGFLKNSKIDIQTLQEDFFLDQFSTSIIVKEGDSGGAVVSNRGELVGFLSNGFLDYTQSDNFEISSCSKASSALKILQNL